MENPTKMFRGAVYEKRLSDFINERVFTATRN
jgi:hypothetical protein